MTASKHTPTPWAILDSERLIVGRDEGCGTETPTADCLAEIVYKTPGLPNRETREANAAFIIQACNAHEDLLEALRGIVDRMEVLADDAEECGYDQRAENTRKDIAAARAAIAKATE